MWLTALREPRAWSGINSLILLFQRIVFKAGEAWILRREPGRASGLSLQPGEIPPAGLYHLKREGVPRAGGTEPLPTLTACGSVNLQVQEQNPRCSDQTSPKNSLLSYTRTWLEVAPNLDSSWRLVRTDPLPPSVFQGLEEPELGAGWGTPGVLQLPEA